jgi:LPPG:FO 2-phospho-L-lactate transferase
MDGVGHRGRIYGHPADAANDRLAAMTTVVALAGGIGAGKFLRGLVRAVPAEDVTVVVNTGDDIHLYGLHVAPDLDSVTYWLGGAMDRERGWGRDGETFRSTEELRAFGADGSWFGLGDLDLATHLYRTQLLSAGRTLAEATAAVAARFGVRATLLPMANGPVATRIDVVDDGGAELDLHFQEYWVRRGGAGDVKAIRFDGVEAARPAPGVLEAIASADAVLLCPSNPVVSIGPILAVPGVRDAVAARRDRVAGVSPIVGGMPVRGMADRLMPAAGAEVSAAGAADCYRGLLSGWVVDEADRALASRIEATGVRVTVMDTIMTGDATAEALARAALELALS